MEERIEAEGRSVAEEARWLSGGTADDGVGLQAGNWLVGSLGWSRDGARQH